MAEDQPQPRLRAKNIVVEYRAAGQLPVRAVAGVDLDLEAGEIVGVVGESGCGKSSLARAMVGLVPLAQGQILLDGEPVKALSRAARDRRARQIQMVFQDPYSSLNPRRTVGRQIEDALVLRGIRDRGKRRARVKQALEEVGLSAQAAAGFPSEFSGGQRQRIAIARALAADPTVVIADEPTSALDASAQAQVIKLLHGLVRERGLTLMLISHDLGLVGSVVDRVAVMYLGRVVEEAPPIELWERPLHPYSEKLIGAIPEPDGLGRRPEVLGGEVPDPRFPPSGCRFRPRCPAAFDACLEKPVRTTIAAGRHVECWLHTDGIGVDAPDIHTRSRPSPSAHSES